MDPAVFHQEYVRPLEALLARLPDPGLRAALRGQGDGYFRACALALWQAEGRALTPALGACYNEIYSGRRPEAVLFWDFVSRGEGARQLPPFPLWDRLLAYDKQTGRGTARLVLEALPGLLLALARGAGEVTLGQTQAVQGYLDPLFAQWLDAGLPGSRAPILVPPGRPAPAQDPQPVPAPPDAPAKEAEAPAPTLEELLAQLDDLCGLEEVKAQIRSLVNLASVRRLRQQAGLPTPPLSLHMVFQGNPGTGKTTVARLVGRLYKAIGVLSQGQLVEVDRAGLVAGYVGQTALKTQEVLDRAKGGVLFIDEAYALSPPGAPSDFGREAIEVLLKGMEDHREDLVVIAAGYTAPMAAFLQSNPGLESRFHRRLTFPDYPPDQLLEIFQSLSRKNGYAPTQETLTAAAAHFTALFQARDETFGNARQVRNTFEDAISRQADRLAQTAAPTKEDLMALLPEDLPPLPGSSEGVL